MRVLERVGLHRPELRAWALYDWANSAFWAGESRAVEVARRGGELVEAIEASGAPFPPEFREGLLTGEETGNTSEVMERLAIRFREDAERKLKLAAQFTSYAIYGLVALMIIFFIFRIASSVFAAGAGAAGGV